MSFLKWVFIIGPPILKFNMGKGAPALDSGEGPGTAGDVPDYSRSVFKLCIGFKRVMRNQTSEWVEGAKSKTSMAFFVRMSRRTD